MCSNKKFCTGCESQCEISSNGYWNFPQIADKIFRDIDRFYTQSQSIEFAEQLCKTCEHYGTTNQPSIIDKHFRIQETCRGCDRCCRISPKEKNNRIYIQVGHNIISEHKNKYDAIIQGLEYCRTCPNRTR